MDQFSGFVYHRAVFDVLIASGKMKTQRPVAGALGSMVLHASVLSALLLGGRPAVRAATEFEQRIAEYFFPKDRAPKIGEESAAYLRIPGGGSGADASLGKDGAGREKDVPTKPRDADQLQLLQPEAGKAAAPNAIQDEVKMAESMGAFALLDVDSAAVRDPNSAAPEYPAEMEAAGLAGLVRVRFVVDSTGRIDMSTAKILEKTNEAFGHAVLAAMPSMRFRPAMMGPKAVRQLAEQDFRFALRPPVAEPAKKKPAK